MQPQAQASQTSEFKNVKLHSKVRKLAVPFFNFPYKECDLILTTDNMISLYNKGQTIFSIPLTSVQGASFSLSSSIKLKVNGTSYRLIFFDPIGAALLPMPFTAHDLIESDKAVVEWKKVFAEAGIVKDSFLNKRI